MNKIKINNSTLSSFISNTFILKFHQWLLENTSYILISIFKVILILKLLSDCCSIKEIIQLDFKTVAVF